MFNCYKRTGLIASLEAMDQEAPVEDQQVAVEEETKEEQTVIPEIDHSEAMGDQLILAAQNEQDRAETQMQEGVETITALEGLIDLVQSSIPHGGLNHQNAKILAKNTNFLYKNIGLESAIKPLVSLEDFNSINHRENKTNVSIEEIKQNIKEIGKRVIQAITVFIQKSIEFLKQIFDQTDRLKKKHEAYVQRLKSVDEPAPHDIKNSSVINALAIGSKVPDSLSSTLSSFVNFGQTINQKANLYATQMGKDYLDLLKNAANMSPSDFEQKHNSLIENYYDYLDNAFLGKVEDNLKSSVVFPGNVIIEGNFVEKADKDGVKKFKFAMRKAEGAEPPEAIKSLDKGEASKLLDRVETMLNIVSSFKESENNLTKAKQEILTAVKSLTAAEEKARQEKNEGVVIRINRIRTGAPATVAVLDALPKLYSRHAMRICGAIFQYIALSFKTEKTEEKESNTNDSREPQAVLA